MKRQAYIPSLWVKIVLIIAIFSAGPASFAASTYGVDYYFDFALKPGEVAVTLKLSHAQKVKLVDFNLKQSSCAEFASESSMERRGDRLLWSPTKRNAQLKFRCPIKHPRKSRNTDQAFDAWWQESYAIFRGDDFVPPARVVSDAGSESLAYLYFRLPETWPHVNTGWTHAPDRKRPKGYSAAFRVDNPSRRFDRPTGWMIAGKLGTRRDTLGTASSTQLAVSAPVVADYSRMDALAFLAMLWPEFEASFGKLPPKILIVSAGDPMWRGGLSAGNSLFLHSGRPMVSENATSTLIHELTHVITGIHANLRDDWIVEGIAEFYASSLLYRAGGLTQARYQKVLENQTRRAGRGKDFRQAASKFAVKAGAANFFYALDKEIRQQTAGQASLDNVVRLLMAKPKVSQPRLADAVAQVSPKSLAIFKDYHLQ